LARFACYRNSVDYLCYIKTGEWIGPIRMPIEANLDFQRVSSAPLERVACDKTHCKPIDLSTTEQRVFG
jgi:hypothetical protein